MPKVRIQFKQTICYDQTVDMNEEDYKSLINLEHDEIMETKNPDEYCIVRSYLDLDDFISFDVIEDFEMSSD